MKSICIYCGSNKGYGEFYSNEVKNLGQIMVERSLDMVYGGGMVGLMGVMARSVMEAGGKVTGIVPEFLIEREMGHNEIPDVIIVKTMHERKQIMADLSDAFIALPGGLGTLDELFEIMTWHQLQLHRKPIGVLNINGFYDHLLKHLDLLVHEGFLHQANRDILIVEDDPYVLLDKLSGFKPTEERNWYIDVR